LTERYQTTVPERVRRVLGLQKRDKIRYDVKDDGSVLLSRAEHIEEEDPVLLAFLSFLERDIENHPERLIPLTQEYVDTWSELTAGVGELDLNAPLSDESA